MGEMYFGGDKMLKKLNLDQTKIYEKHLALEQISIMLVSFVKGRPYHLAIGAEQGNIDQWDDLVIKKNNVGYIYIQAKRQTTDFSPDSIVRDTYKRMARKGQLRDLSPMDKAFESLGKRMVIDDLENEFWLALPEGSTQIKDGLEVRHLRKLCEQYIKSVTTADKLIELANKDSDVHNIYLWLTTWCDFSDWEHIFKALRILKIKTSEFESDINVRVASNLSEVFKTSEIEHVRMLILSYLDENATFAGEIKPRQLLYLLKEYLQTDIVRWTLFQTDGLCWNIGGIHDLEHNNEIERPSIMVPSLWDRKNQYARLLKIYGGYIENCHISNSLMRLALHPFGTFNVHCSDMPSWQNAIKMKTGGTIGVSKNDLNDLRILDGLQDCQMIEPIVLNTIDAMENHAIKLHSEMYKIVFNLVDFGIKKKIEDMPRSNLRTEVEARWMEWKQLLKENIEEQRKLFLKILHPKAEGESISGELRVGPKTEILLTEAIYLLLVVSVCLGDTDNKNWEWVTNKLSMNSIGLAFWSGPSSGPRKVIEIDDDACIGKLLENEQGHITIISQCKLPGTEVFQDDIAGESGKSELLTHPNYPKLLITNNRTFKRKLLEGDISKLRSYFKSSLDKYESEKENAVKKVVDEVVV